MDSIALLDKDHILKNSLPIFPKCGIYFLIKDSEIVYVGKSTHMPNRVKTHQLAKDFDRVFFISCSKWDLTSLEREYIQKFDPVLNQLLRPKPEPEKPPKPEEYDPQDYSPVALLCKGKGWSKSEFLREAVYHTSLSSTTLLNVYRGKLTLRVDRKIRELSNLFGVSREQLLNFPDRA